MFFPRLNVQRLCLLATCALNVQNIGADEPERITPQELHRALEQLGDESFKVREAASLTVWKAGPAAIGPLEQLLKESKDTEVIFRARTILEKARYGIYPDTAPAHVALINRYRQGSIQDKQSVLQHLGNEKKFDTLFALLKTENDATQKQLMNSSVMLAISTSIGRFLVEGDFARAEQIMEWGATRKNDMTQARNYGAMLLMQGKLEQKIDELHHQWKRSPETSNPFLLAVLLSLSGKNEEAIQLLKPSENKYDSGNRLLADLYYRTSNWKKLAEKGFVPGDTGVENFGFTAAYSRLAVEHQKFERAIDDLRQLAIEQPDRTWMCGEALMINGRWDEAVELHRDRNPLMAFRILCEQSKFDEAFDLIELENLRTGSIEWFEKKAKPLEPQSDAMAKHLRFGHQLVRLLVYFGEREQAEKLLDVIAKVPVDPKYYRTRQLIETEIRFGFADRAIARADDSIDHPRQSSLFLYPIFRSQRDQAVIWHEYFWKQEHKTAVAKTLKLMRPEEDQRLSEVQLREFADNVEREERWLSEREGIYTALADLCLIHHQPNLALQYFVKQNAIATTPVLLTKIGDLHFQNEDWDQAVDYYDQAWARDQSKALPLYLKGHALKQQGKIDEGEQLMRIALIQPLANSDIRAGLAKGLEERDFDAEAIRQWELVLRLGRFDTWEGSSAWSVRDAAQRIGNHVGLTDKLRASHLWERQLFYLLKTNSAFNEIEGYPKQVHLIYHNRAQGLVKEGKFDEAIENFKSALETRSDSSDATINLVKCYELRGMKAHAEARFKRAATLYEKILKQFPNSAHHHNNLAWLCARCQRRLDDALAHANRAVELSPQNASYLDTLAEVHFQRGDVEKAIELEKRSLEFYPDNLEYLQQLKRFEAALKKKSNQG